jgi:hypothetical protein
MMAGEARKIRWLVLLVLALALLAGEVLSCGSSSLEIHLRFPDDQALADTDHITILALAPEEVGSCQAALGRRLPQLPPDALLAQAEIVPGGQELVFSDLPLRHMLLSALAYDGQDRLFLVGCTEVQAKPGQRHRVEIVLASWAGGSCVNSTDCPAGLDCDGGTCRCVPGGRCGGCCEDDVCHLGITKSQCGKGGAPCEACSAGPCSTASCVSRSCVVSPATDGAGCPDGTCHDGHCCTGCWNGTTCPPGTSTTACGSDGEACTDCAGLYVCKEVSCVAGSCTATGNAADGSSCPDGSCLKGSCCTGCVNFFFSCVSGKTLANCGTDGTPCGTCYAPDSCSSASCTTGVCQLTPKPDGSLCNNGVCHDASCCTGCWDSASSTCKAGTTNTACGAKGQACQDCTASSQTCSAGSCGTD